MDLSVAWLLTCGVAFIGTVVIREIYMWLRYLMPKSVACWFCMHKTEVPYNLWNSWHCPKCEQYNGFTHDGDYNKVIDQQYDSKLNFSVSTYGRCKNAWRKENSLCSKCNRNQELKVEQLAKFVPLNERNYDAEIDHFRAQIEKAYALCDHCETLLDAVLRREREEYCCPRRLNTTFIPKNCTGTWTLWLNTLTTVVMFIIGFLQTKGASVVKKALKSSTLPFLKKHVPTAYSVVNQIRPTAIREIAVFLSDYALLFSALLCLLTYYRTQRQHIELLFNSLFWLGLLAVSLHHENGAIEWIPLIQTSLSVLFCHLSISLLNDLYANVREQQLKQQTFLQPKVSKTMNYSPKHAPNGTSTPRGTPPGSRFSYVDSTSHSVRNLPTEGDRGISSHLGKWPGKYVGLEPGIKGLNLGSGASHPRDDDVQSLWSSNTVSHAATNSYNPNASCWSLYSTAPNMTTRSATNGHPMGLGSLMHVYSHNSTCGEQSRRTSPAQTMLSQSGTSFHTAVDSTMRRRNLMSNGMVSQTR